MPRYDFWTHGVNTIVQFPEFTKSIAHTGMGTLVEQQGSPNNTNWLHIPIPSPTVFDGTKVTVSRVRIRGSVNNKAFLEELQILVDGESKVTHPFGQSVTGRKFDMDTNLGNFILAGGLVVTLRVKFISPTGKVTIHGAGIHFEQVPVK